MDEVNSKRWVMRWWPMLYSVMWLIWGIFAPEPWFLNSTALARSGAFIGAIGLFIMGMWPGEKFVRFFGTLAAIIYPLYRALSIAGDSDGALDFNRQVVAITFSLTIVISLLVLYPSLWWVSNHRGMDDE